ncbi:hypothetical protein B4Q04_20170 [Zobellia sp. OII3]|uniref:hypothetical protein n=1 Tax=Zobellia sp. OII3 TaxID=2034520 RepID=UPI000B530F54|nr:hypothetical protein [Zobellia sp. OII3]OWW23517.1 hypothetical protein B4Q04_20170 [Zobellia sp. OII3]
MNKTKLSHKIVAIFLTLIFLPSMLPTNYIFASNNGPNAPEAASFEPVDATDMVNLVSGDVSYVLPLINMDGFPLSLSYHAGIPLDMESSWAGLGWNVNAGAISRSVSGTPDDWNGGESLDFISYEDNEEFYNINVGVGISQAAEVGVGVSWGSNKSLSGSVYAGFMGVNASIATDGAYSAGVGLNVGGGNFGGSLSIGVSGNVNGGGASFGFGLGAGHSSGARASLGYSLSGSGGSFSFSGGYGNRSSGNKGLAGAGGGLSLANYSSGDYDISSKGFFVPVQIWIFNLSFGYRKVNYKLNKGYPKLGYGGLYAKNAFQPTMDSDMQQDSFNDLQHRYRYSDLYEEAIPQTEEEFIEDYAQEREKVNFSFASYDSYSVNASGMSGLIQPKIFQNSTLFGLGYAGPDTDDSNRNMRVYYHHVDEGSESKTFGTSIYNNSSDIEFYFNGQFTENISIPNTGLSSNSSGSFENYITSTTTNNTRQRSGNFVEVFTNDQLANDHLLRTLKPDNADYANWPADGIGAYRITAPDGKIYHYSLPVYHYERVERNLIKDNTEKNVNEKRQYSPYATHWLLTAITGPDYVDRNNNSQADEEDYGYWVRMDYGKWSDGFVWRSPYKGKKYNTNLVGEIEEKDFGNYQYGRKQLYYLDKIVNRSHTAYFVKDIRYDSSGAYGINDYDDANNEEYRYIFDGAISVDNDTNSGPSTEWVKEDIHYKREYQLMLDKIVVVQNKDSISSKNINPNLVLNNGNCLPGYDDDTDAWNPRFHQFGGFARAYGPDHRYALHQEKNVYDVTDFINFDYSKALRVIDMKYTYDLAANTPSSLTCSYINEGGGKLTLTEVNFRGKKNFSYMPPYKFTYKNEMEYPVNLRFNKSSSTDYLTGQAKDGWGYIDEKQVAEYYNSSDYQKYGPDNWSLSEITTPTGGKIKLAYEEDDYESEAFSRKLFQEDLQFAVQYERYQNCGYEGENFIGPCDVTVFVKNLNGLNQERLVNFSDYFEIGDRVYMDLWICKVEDKQWGGGDDRASLSLPGSNKSVSEDYDKWAQNGKHFSDVIVEDILSDNTLVLSYQINHNIGWQFFLHGDVNASPISSPNSGLTYFGKKDNIGSPRYKNSLRGECIKESGGKTTHTMSYKLLANKIPKNLKGGGLRARSITVSDDNGREYKTNYYYNKPGTSRDKNDLNYVSSGITSFAPENGIKFIPYQSELPSPGVMYEYVTMVPETTNGNELGYTRYRFHTLDPVFDLFDPNIELSYKSEKINPITGEVEEEDITIFESEVIDPGDGDYFNSSDKTYAKYINLKVNTSLVGQFRSIETFNRENHLMSKTQKFYKSGEEAKAISGRGAVRESFNSMKSVYSTNGNDESPQLKNRLISISSKEDFNSVLTEVRTTTGGFTTSEKYSNADPQTGIFRTTEMTKANGTRYRKTHLPAYTQYEKMGSKVDNIRNQHMLTQKAMTTTDVFLNNNWRTTAASINTWSQNTLYDNSSLVESDNIWRKYQTFLWKDNVANDGSFGALVTEDNFDWGYGVTQSNTQWQKISETTRYNHWSSPLEMIDINANYLSTKMGDDNKKVYAVGNASYSEIFYSGAEDWDSDKGTFGGHVGIGDAVEETSSNNIHTGKKSLRIGTGQTAFNVTVKEGKSDRYKISLWAKFGLHENIKVKVGSSTPYIEFSTNETVRAGDWIQLNYYFQVDGQKEVSIINESGTAYVDDFRLHPVSSSMTSYVYNEWDELTYVLGANNLGTQYEYDDAGRLWKTYKEVEDFNGAGTGGFKRVSKHDYSYEEETEP